MFPWQSQSSSHPAGHLFSFLSDGIETTDGSDAVTHSPVLFAEHTDRHTTTKIPHKTRRADIIFTQSLIIKGCVAEVKFCHRKLDSSDPQNKSHSLGDEPPAVEN